MSSVNASSSPRARSSDTDRLLRLPPVRRRLEFQFALLSAAGGLVLASGQGTQGIALLAVFMAIIGFVFVDWLRIFELPATVAYLAMGGAAAYCVHDFWGLQERGQSQMVSVAFLLVLVQGVLMMQQKSRRILEQLAVFCLLELVVAAIFNDALAFGLLMIPITIIGASALSLLGLVSTMESIEVSLDNAVAIAPQSRLERVSNWFSGSPEVPLQSSSFVKTASVDSAESMYLSARSWSRFAVIVFAPAIFLIAAAFFYALPRKVDAERSSTGGPALVGFSDEVHLEQLGQIMNNPKTALKVRLTDLESDRPYLVSGSLYLRGKVLENYEVKFGGPRPVSKWTAAERDSMSLRDKLPLEWQPRGQYTSDLQLFDRVAVSVDCETMSRPALFSIAPYYKNNSRKDVVHAIDRWTLAREIDEPPFPKLRYGFGTHAFSKGQQTRWIAQASERQRMLRSTDFNFGGLFRKPRPSQRVDYRQVLLQYDRSLVPTAALLAEQVLESVPEDQRTQTRIAIAMESFLANNRDFSYTLNLNAEPQEGVDLIEQFLSRDRRGHCQYFASALTMMLRSVGIPCRLVVGYRTEEYNRFSEYYIARQQHAHLWVEARIDATDIPSNVVVAGQRRSERYWMRLDPTPGASLAEDRDTGGVDGILDLATNLWEDYVVEMDSERQGDNLIGSTGFGEVQSSYRNLFSRLEKTVANIQAGRLGGGEFSVQGRPPIHVIAMVLGLLALLFLMASVRIPKWSWWKRSTKKTKRIEQPSIDFYAETLRQLGRVGILRGDHETPGELNQRVGQRFPSLGLLTQHFQQQRYGHTSPDKDSSAMQQALAQLKSAVDGQLRNQRR